MRRTIFDVSYFTKKTDFSVAEHDVLKVVAKNRKHAEALFRAYADTHYIDNVDKVFVFKHKEKKAEKKSQYGIVA